MVSEERTQTDEEGREIRREMIYGMIVDVVVCRPSRRRAASRIQWARRRKRGPGGMWMARDRDLKTGE
jgi:predicted LPLAT superfamily acyltransferase